MCQISNLPNNEETLFMRNLEAILIEIEFISLNDVMNYRDNIAPSIFELLRKYKHACQDGSVVELQNRFIEDSINIRTHLELENI